MNIYLTGQSHFGRATLAMLLEDGRNIVGVSAPTEDKKGREDLLHAFASVYRLPLLPAGQLKAATLPDGVDLILAAHSHDFISKKTRQKARIGALGYHPSLLPLHRGRDAIKWTLRDRDKITGGSCYWLTDVVDGGPIAAQDYCFVLPNDDPQTLWKRELMPMGLRLFRRVLRDLDRGKLVRIPQDARLASWEPSMDAPPLHRPDLPELGNGGWAGLQVVVERENA